MKKKQGTGAKLLTGLVVGGGLAALYNFRRQLLARYYKLSPVEYPTTVERDIDIAMPDGIILKHDHYHPATPGQYPTILIRTPYGRERESGVIGLLQGLQNQFFSERGYNVIVQSVRGRFKSGGKFIPMAHEAEDGRASVEWISRQPWFNGQLALWGSSYLGYVQWAVATQNPPELKAFMPTITGSQFYSLTYPGGAVALDLVARWTYLVEVMDSKGQRSQWEALQLLSPKKSEQALQAAFATLPLAEADVKMLGSEVEFYRNTFKYQDLAAHPEYWEKRNHNDKVANVQAPAYLIGGWYDIFLNELVADYLELKEAGHNPYLTIGDWTHISMGVQATALREGLAWFDARLKGKTSGLRQKPVNLFVLGENSWRELESFPPPSQPAYYFLQDKKQLATVPPVESAPDTYSYNPNEPTPALGGAFLMAAVGKLDNRPLEARPDVLTYTSAPLQKDLEVIGLPKLILYAKSSLEHTDFFARLCDVQPDGTSYNISDGFIRLNPGATETLEDGSLKIEIRLGATACRFKAGHRLRLQVSSGAHPRFNRNPGTGESLLHARQFEVAEQTVFHDQHHLSALILPVTAG